MSSGFCTDRLTVEGAGVQHSEADVIGAEEELTDSEIRLPNPSNSPSRFVVMAGEKSTSSRRKKRKKSVPKSATGSRLSGCINTWPKIVRYPWLLAADHGSQTLPRSSPGWVSWLGIEPRVPS